MFLHLQIDAGASAAVTRDAEVRGRYGAAIGVVVEARDHDHGRFDAAREARREDPEYVDALARDTLDDAVEQSMERTLVGACVDPLLPRRDAACPAARILHVRTVLPVVHAPTLPRSLISRGGASTIAGGGPGAGSPRPGCNCSTK